MDIEEEWRMEREKSWQAAWTEVGVGRNKEKEVKIKIKKQNKNKGPKSCMCLGELGLDWNGKWD